MQPNQDLNAFIITDEAHLRAKELAAQMNAVAQASIQADLQQQQADAEMRDAAAAAEELAREAEMEEAAAKANELDLKTMPTFKDRVMVEVKE